MFAENHQYQTINQPGVSEIILPETRNSSLELVLPMLAHLSHKAGSRWMSWIGTNNLSKSTFDEYQFENANVRLIRSQSNEETLWMMWDALNHGTSSFVVGEFQSGIKLQRNEVKQLEQACYSGNCRALILKYR